MTFLQWLARFDQSEVHLDDTPQMGIPHPRLRVMVVHRGQPYGMTMFISKHTCLEFELSRFVRQVDRSSQKFELAPREPRE